MFEKRLVSYLYLLGLVFVLQSVARPDQQPQERQTERTGLFVGAGVLVKDEPFKGVGTEVYPLPFYMYQGRAFTMRGLSATYELSGNDELAIRALARFRTDGYDADDSSDLRGMSDRRNSLDLGAELWLENSWGNIGLDVVTDALSEHHGHEATLSYVLPIRGPFGIKELGLRPMLGLSWRSQNLNNYYYGVRAKEALAGRAAYRSGDAVNPHAGIVLDYQLAERWSIFSLFRNEWLAGDITDSPIIDQHNVVSVIVGLLYRF